MTSYLDPFSICLVNSFYYCSKFLIGRKYGHILSIGQIRHLSYPFFCGNYRFLNFAFDKITVLIFLYDIALNLSFS